VPAADGDTAPDLLSSAEEMPIPPEALGGTKIGAIILGVLGALWMSYIGYLNANEE